MFRTVPYWLCKCHNGRFYAVDGMIWILALGLFERTEIVPFLWLSRSGARAMAMITGTIEAYKYLAQFLRDYIGQV